MLTIDRLALKYGAVQALYDVSLHIDAGEVVALLGANGAGKTTLLHAMMGLLEPASGEIVCLGRSLLGQPSRLIVKRGLALVPEGRQLFGDMTVRENLEVSFSRSLVERLNRKAFQARLDEVAAFFPRVIERLNQQAGTLSGGEQQMVAICRALMSEPRLLLLDEPSLGLSPVMIDTLMEVLIGLHHSGLSMLLVEQNAEAALELADRAYVLERGVVVLEGTGSALLDDPRVQQAYLGF